MSASSVFGLIPHEALGDRESLWAQSSDFLEWQTGRGRSPLTVTGQRKRLRPFLRWCEGQGLLQGCEVSREDLELYAQWVHRYRKADGEPLRARTRHGYLHVVVQLFGWLHRERRILVDPAVHLELPRLGRSLPGVLTAGEAERVLAQPDVSRGYGLRDRAILELLYSTGVRRGELVRLKLEDLDAGRGVAFVWQGKGRKDRVVPVGERALDWVSSYLSAVRRLLVREPDCGALFLSRLGRALSANHLTAVVSGYVKAAGLGQRGACHLFRHTAATLMLEGGADTRHVQEFLGHACLDSTQVYTHVAIGSLKAAHAAAHPAEVQR